MGPLPNLVYYSSVAAKGTLIVAEYADGDEDLPTVAAKCLDRVPPFHSRFSYTTKRRMFGCIIEDPFIYCAIMDEALGKVKAFSFLEQVRDEFKIYLRVRGLALDGKNFRSHSLDDDFGPVFRRLVVPFVGIPQKEKDRLEEELRAKQEAEDDFQATSPSAGEEDEQEVAQNSEKSRGSRSPSTPLIGKGKKHKKKKLKDQKEAKDIKMENKGKAMDKVQMLEIMVEGSNQPLPSSHMQKTGSMRSRGQQMARRMWWRNVKLVLILDGIICLILLAVWLGVCGGISCMQKKSDGT